MQFQNKYQEEKRKYESLLKMQKTILTDNEGLMRAAVRIKNQMAKMRGDESMDEDEEITPDQAEILADQVITALKKSIRGCQCDRWKILYQRESVQTLKLSQCNQELMTKLKEKEQQQLMDRGEIGRLLNDYLELYRKQFYIEKEDKQKKRQKKEHTRSKSKGKGVQSQTQRKTGKSTINIELTNKEQTHIKSYSMRMQRDLHELHRQIQQLRDKNIQAQQYLRIYRSKQRKYMLQGAYSLD